MGRVIGVAGIVVLLATSCGPGARSGSPSPTAPTSTSLPATTAAPAESSTPATTVTTAAPAPTTTATSVVPDEPVVDALSDGSFTCCPGGPGPFPGVAYSHGGRRGAIGGDLRGTCEALAEAGYVAHAQHRRDEDNMGLQLLDAQAGLDTLLAHPDLDPGRIGIIGFSRGGLLTLQMTVERPGDVHAAVLMAPAHGIHTMEETLQEVTPVDDPVLVLVAENDLMQADHVAIAHDVEAALTTAGKDVRLVVYPPYGDDGHDLFSEVRDPYWPDLLAFLASHL
jgi:dienelactone hydrolase